MFCGPLGPQFIKPLLKGLLKKPLGVARAPDRMWVLEHSSEHLFDMPGPGRMAEPTPPFSSSCGEVLVNGAPPTRRSDHRLRLHLQPWNSHDSALLRAYRVRDLHFEGKDWLTAAHKDQIGPKAALQGVFNRYLVHSLSLQGALLEAVASPEVGS